MGALALPPGMVPGQIDVFPIPEVSGARDDRRAFKIVFDRTFSDKGSGKDTKRPQLAALIAFVRAGDTVMGEDSPMANLMLSVMGAFAEVRLRNLSDR